MIFSTNDTDTSLTNYRAKGLIGYFFNFIGQALYIDALDQPYQPPSQHNFYSGRMVLSTISEIVMLFRFLMSEPAWQAPISEAVTAALRVVPSIVQPDCDAISPNALKSDIYAALAALCVIGNLFYSNSHAFRRW